jgi:hypothetical protein
VKEDFTEQYVKRRVPVVLENCTAEWTAQQAWTAESLLMDRGGGSPWRVDYRHDIDPFDPEVRQTLEFLKYQSFVLINQLFHDRFTVYPWRNNNWYPYITAVVNPWS